MKLRFLFINIVLLMSLSASAATPVWTLKMAKYNLNTKWASKVKPDSVLQEYPRPQLVRTDWQNLNGLWQFKIGAKGDAVPAAGAFDRVILVPFPVESSISGVMENNQKYVWYRHTFTISDSTKWKDKRVILHFGAIDWESEIYLNGKSVCLHKGGYDAFSIDITDNMTSFKDQEIKVRVFDPTRDYGQPRGKQTSNPGGIMYTATTGIWQTVWLEPVAPRNITSLKLIPDIDAGVLKITVNTANAEGLTISAIAKDGATVVGTVTGNANTPLTIPIPNAKLWSPESPFLYDLKVELKKGDVVQDTVLSYFGMRKVSIGKVGGKNRILFNNKFVFQMGPLDQGFWPDGCYTAPTDEALRYDIEQTKALGFNMTRKHIKVEPQRWYYWADKLGIMVWQDMPSANSYDPPRDNVLNKDTMKVDTAQFRKELVNLVTDHMNSPCIVSWVTFNEYQSLTGVNSANDYVLLVRSMDPTRVVNSGSGGPVENASQIEDIHSYSPPSFPVSSTKANVCGEFGGIGYRVPGHYWTNTSGSPYGDEVTETSFVKRYTDYIKQMMSFKTINGLNAGVYTEITDVETEINGFMTYDRIMKLNAANTSKIKTINERLINENVKAVIDILPTSKRGTSSWVTQTWKSTTVQPVSSWNTSSFDDSKWKTSQAPFGNDLSIAKTSWNGAPSDIWLRKEITLEGMSADDRKRIALTLRHDENCEVYVNGYLIGERGGYVTDYYTLPIEMRRFENLINYFFTSNKKLVVAVHCINKEFGQFVDVGVSKIIFDNDTTSAYNPAPKYAVTSVDTLPTLTWTAGNNSSSHSIYLGTTEATQDFVANQTGTSYKLSVPLKPGTTYYWRVDEVNDASTVKGAVWNFTTGVATGLSLNQLPTFNLYPNPVKRGGVVTIELGEESGKYESLGIWSVDGTFIYSQPIQGKHTVNINLSDIKIPSGIYLVRTVKNGKYGMPQKMLITD